MWYAYRSTMDICRKLVLLVIMLNISNSICCWIQGSHIHVLSKAAWCYYCDVILYYRDVKYHGSIRVTFMSNNTMIWLHYMNLDQELYMTTHIQQQMLFKIRNIIKNSLHLRYIIIWASSRLTYTTHFGYSRCIFWMFHLINKPLF